MAGTQSQLVEANIRRGEEGRPGRSLEEEGEEEGEEEEEERTADMQLTLKLLAKICSRET